MEKQTGPCSFKHFKMEMEFVYQFFDDRANKDKTVVLKRVNEIIESGSKASIVI